MPTEGDIRVAYATCAALPSGDEDFEAVAYALGAGVACDPVPWDSPVVDWRRFDLIVVRSTWDYSTRVEEFLAWVHAMHQLLNPADVIEWNHDKRYLAALGAAGIPVVPTRWDPTDLPPGAGRWVAKPAVSNGARRTIAGDADEVLAHVELLRRAGQRAMVQPYLDGIDERGETALLYIDDRLSHAVRKRAALGIGRRRDGTYAPDHVVARTPTTAELDVAEATLDAIPFPRDELLYARVDLVPGDDGEPLLLELELIEPSLFLSHADGAADRFAAAILRRL